MKSYFISNEGLCNSPLKAVFSHAFRHTSGASLALFRSSQDRTQRLYPGTRFRNEHKMRLGAVKKRAAAAGFPAFKQYRAAAFAVIGKAQSAFSDGQDAGGQVSKLRFADAPENDLPDA